MQLVLVGNPNSGKTSLFNILTGGNQHVGNWPGVTVEKKDGVMTLFDQKLSVIDLPGIYNLDPDSAEQKITRDYIYNEKPDIIVNILDAVNIERNLFLTLQLREYGIPMVVVLNMMDELEGAGLKIDIVKLSALLGVPAVFISASKGTGISELKKIIDDTLQNKEAQAPFCSGCSSCTKCKEGEFRYKFIDSIIANCVEKETTMKNDNGSVKLDKILLNRFLALPIFLLVMFGIFTMTFGAPITALSTLINDFLGFLSTSLNDLLSSLRFPHMLISLICDGAIPGIGTVLVFLPQITVLFILMSLLEDSGYMSRAAFIMDKLFSFFGLTGSSFIPLLMGFGCSVPAIMACRILPSQKDRRLTIMLTSFMSCSARLPLYALLTGVFFKKNQGLIIFFIYFLGIFIAMISALILNKTVFRNSNSAFVMEVPPYRLPKLKNLFLHTYEKVKGFAVKAGTTLLLASIIIWFLKSFSTSFVFTANADKSILAFFGGLIAPLFAPLGFGSWQAATAVITGVFAKEMIVSTLSVLSNSNGQEAVITSFINSHFTTLTSFVFMSFVLIYLPCLSAIVTMKREFNSLKWTAGTLLFSFSVAWIVSFVIYSAGTLIGF